MKKSLPGLRDIKRRVIDLAIGDVTLKVRGLSAGDIVLMMNRFEPVRKMLEGGREEVEKAVAGPNAAQMLITTLPDAVWWAMATCTGTTPDRRAEDEKIASELDLGDQVAIVSAIFEATFREGFGPFRAMLDRLAQIMRPTTTETNTTAAPASPSASRRLSPAALYVDLPPERLGRLRLAS